MLKETNTIILEPGQTIKQKIITKGKLKPKNEDGSQNMIIIEIKKYYLNSVYKLISSFNILSCFFNNFDKIFLNII